LEGFEYESFHGCELEKKMDFKKHCALLANEFSVHIFF